LSNGKPHQNRYLSRPLRLWRQMRLPLPRLRELRF
jgi:hypothetical protein